MGKADFYANGRWNFYCDFCGAKNKSSDAMKTWDGYYVCKHHKEVRNPQDFIRGVKDNQSVPWTRPEKEPETFTMACSLRGTNAIPGYAIPGCAVPSYVNLAFLPSDPLPGGPLCTLDGLNGLPGYAVPGCSIPSYNNVEQEENSALDTYEGMY